MAQVTTAPLPAPPSEHPPLRVGLMVGVINVPRPLSAELFTKVYDVVGFGFSYSAIPSGLGDAALQLFNVKDATFSSSALDGEVRLFPFAAASSSARRWAARRSRPRSPGRPSRCPPT